MRRLVRSAALLTLPLALLTGCFEYSEDYWVEADASTRMKVRAAVDRDFLEAEDLEDIREALTEIERGLAEHPEVIDHDVHDAETGDDHEFVIDFTLTHYRHIGGSAGEGVRGLVDGALADEGLTPFSDAPIRFEDLPDGRVRFTRVLRDEDALAAAGPLKDPDFTDRFLEFRVHAPKVVRRDRSAQEDAERVEWKFPVDSGDVPARLSADLSLTSDSLLSVSWSWWWGAPAVVLGLFGLWLRGKWATRMM